MAALSRFVSRLGERAMPFYKLLKKQDKFQWTPEAKQAFDEFKEFLTCPPVLVPPMPEEPLLLYIVVIHCSNLARGQHGYSCRARRGRPHPESSAPSVLRQRSPERVKSKVSSSSENSICRANHVSKASALLPGASHNDGHKLPDR